MVSILNIYNAIARYVLPVFVLLAVFLYVDGCSRSVAAEEKAARNLFTIVARHREYKDAAGRKIALANQLLVDERMAKFAGLREIERLKSIRHQAQIEVQTEYRDVAAPFSAPVAVRRDTLPAPSHSGTWIETPARFAASDRWYRFSGRLDTSGVHLDSLVTLSAPVLTIGTEKPGIRHLFQAPVPVATYQDDNPNVRVTSMRIITIEQKKPLYLRPWFVFSAGLIGGTLAVRAL